MISTAQESNTMFDSEIQSATTTMLQAKLEQLKWATNAGQIDLAVRIAKELRYRGKFSNKEQRR